MGRLESGPEGGEKSRLETEIPPETSTTILADRGDLTGFFGDKMPKGSVITIIMGTSAEGNPLEGAMTLELSLEPGVGWILKDPHRAGLDDSEMEIGDQPFSVYRDSFPPLDGQNFSDVDPKGHLALIPTGRTHQSIMISQIGEGATRITAPAGAEGEKFIKVPPRR